MRENEATAHQLAGALHAVGVDARVSGEGVHWKVDVAPQASRSLVVHCFWYERVMSGLFIGMNPANGRSRLRRAALPREGADYLVIAFETGLRVADGRTSVASDVVECTRAWLAGVDLEALWRATPFIDGKRRTMRAVADRLDPRLRWDIEGEPGYELWVYGDNRSCKVTDAGSDVDCAFLIGQAQVAYATSITDVPSVTSAWLLQGIPAQQLRARVPNVELERHAEILEADPARWHWLHVLDRIDNPTDVLAPLRDLIEALATRPAVTRFFSYSSLNRLCLSASSHYPWVDRELPVISPMDDRGYRVGDTPCDLARAIDVVETTVRACPIRPFFGSAPHHELPLLSQSLAGQGSLLRPAVEQHGAWHRLVVESGSRKCVVDDRNVVFIGGTHRRRISYESLDNAARGIRSYLDAGVPLDELAER
jgi:hypothetical protein